MLVLLENFYMKINYKNWKLTLVIICPPYYVRIGYSIHILHETTKINFQFLSEQFIHSHKIYSLTFVH